MQVLGIDVGGTKVEIASVTDGRARQPRRIPTPLEDTEALIDGILQLHEKVRREKIGDYAAGKAPIHVTQSERGALKPLG